MINSIFCVSELAAAVVILRNNVLGKDLSFIALDEKTGDIAGFILCFDLACDLESRQLPFAGLLSFFRMKYL